MTKRRALAAFEVFAMYLLTGAGCITIGSSMTHLITHYGSTLAAVAALGSGFALGRVITVSFMGLLVEKLGPKPVQALGLVLLLCFFVGLPMTTNYAVALVASVLGGIGFSTQDACSPVILSGAFPTGYASAMSAGEAFFGAGCFLPPLLMSILLPLGLPFYSVYYLFAGLAVVLLAVLPFAEVPDTKQLAQEGGHAANPLFLRAKIPGWLLLALFAVTYCAVPNTVNLYTTTFAASIGIPEAIGGLLLTAYNVGSMVGSLVFIGLLKRFRPINVLWVNALIALGMLLAAVLLQSVPVFFVTLFFAGFFLGVLFMLIITIATGLRPAHAGMMGGIVGLVCGSSDTVTPLITGRVVTWFGAGAAYWYALAMMAIAALAAIGFRRLCYEGERQPAGAKAE